MTRQMMTANDRAADAMSNSQSAARNLHKRVLFPIEIFHETDITLLSR